jgi:hypothetical protein
LANNGCHIYPVLLNVTKIDEDIISRYRSHTVLALALSHHLRLAQGYPFLYIAKLFASLTEEVLITEFMPNGLGIGKPQPDPLPGDYTLDAYLNALRNYFKKVRVIDYDREPTYSPRTLVVCEK